MLFFLPKYYCIRFLWFQINLKYHWLLTNLVFGLIGVGVEVKAWFWTEVSIIRENNKKKEKKVNHKKK